jgi:hypothetical protein
MNLKTLLIITLSLGLANCASITQGTTQSLIFDLDPSTARCSLTREGDGEIGSISSKNNTISVDVDWYIVCYIVLTGLSNIEHGHVMLAHRFLLPSHHIRAHNVTKQR